MLPFRFLPELNLHWLLVVGTPPLSRDLHLDRRTALMLPLVGESWAAKPSYHTPWHIYWWFVLPPLHAVACA